MFVHIWMYSVINLRKKFYVTRLADLEASNQFGKLADPESQKENAPADVT